MLGEPVLCKLSSCRCLSQENLWLIIPKISLSDKILSISSNHCRALQRLANQSQHCQDLVYCQTFSRCSQQHQQIFVKKKIWASLVAQLVKNPPAMQETWIQSLGWEDPLEKGKATHSSILAWRSPWSHKESDTTEQLSFSQNI